MGGEICRGKLFSNTVTQKSVPMFCIFHYFN
jgi:hypothetical protein